MRVKQFALWKSMYGIILVIITVFFVAHPNGGICQINSKETLYIDLSKKPKKKDIPLSEIASSIKYVALETRQDLIVGSCSARPAGSNLLISQEGTPLYLFDQNGSFINEIGQIGQGPGEYLSGNQRGYCEENSCVYVMDVFQNRIIKYDQQGKHIETFKLHNNSNSFQLIGKDRFMLYSSNTQYGDDKYGLYILQGNTIIKWFTPPEKLANMQAVRNSSYLIQQVDARTFLANSRYGKQLNAYTDSGDSWIFARVDMGNKQIPDGVYSTQEKYQSKHRDYIHNLYQYATPGYVFIHYVEAGQIELVLYNRKNKETNSIDSKDLFDQSTSTKFTRGFINDIDGGPSLFECRNIINGKAYVVLQPFDLLNYYDDDKLKETSGAFAKLMAGLDINDNPVIMIIDLK